MIPARSLNGPADHRTGQRGLRICELLLRHGADVDAPDAEGGTALLHAALKGAQADALAALLVARGAKRQKADRHGNRPVDFGVDAMLERHKEAEAREETWALLAVERVRWHSRRRG